ncbi:MAG: hypothetical protein ABFS28_08885 [Bacteroidota bacterium]
MDNLWASHGFLMSAIAVSSTTATGDPFVFKSFRSSLAASPGEFGFAVNKKANG